MQLITWVHSASKEFYFQYKLYHFSVFGMFFQYFTRSTAYCIGISIPIFQYLSILFACAFIQKNPYIYLEDMGHYIHMTTHTYPTTGYHYMCRCKHCVCLHYTINSHTCIKHKLNSKLCKPWRTHMETTDLAKHLCADIVQKEKRVRN